MEYPKHDEMFMEIHALRMVIRDYESRLDRYECKLAESLCRRSWRVAPQDDRKKGQAEAGEATPEAA